MILLSRLNGAEFALNPDLIERADSTPDTVITLTDGTKYVVSESIHELTARVRDFRASVRARATSFEESGTYSAQEDPDHSGPDDDGTVRVLRPLRGI